MKTINNQQSTINNRSFTLIEILVVVTIIGVLFGVATISYSSLTKSSRDARRKSDLEQIKAALEMYRSNNPLALYPSAASCEELDGLIDSYLPNFPKDPKDGTYTYSCSTSDSDYTIGAYLEITTSSCTSIGGGGCTVDCNYCVGPYGQKL